MTEVVKKKEDLHNLPQLKEGERYEEMSVRVNEAGIVEKGVVLYRKNIEGIEEEIATQFFDLEDTQEVFEAKMLLVDTENQKSVDELKAKHDTYRAQLKL